MKKYTGQKLQARWPVQPRKTLDVVAISGDTLDHEKR